MGNTRVVTNQAMLRAFYERAVLPQFGVGVNGLRWESSQALDADESTHWFTVNDSAYVLIFEDYDGLGRSPAFIRDKVLSEKQPFEFVVPISQTAASPSYDGFRLPRPSQYCPNITGTYTLLRLLDTRTLSH